MDDPKCGWSIIALTESYILSEGRAETKKLSEGPEAYSHHDKFPPWWESVHNGKGGGALGGKRG